ncbi:TIGR04222 domain-containing membrane protein [Micromonospora yasonensis]|uniref:TIGR04222 domain-containing membrane protein n=1 Tax=Micromonospora yasonensis TaxID=1128667 RepID=UPI0022302D97|nr:TIGR04222 domain-containing membrane protein [Micromonospora yasonensis]MCW3844563.1 TIGR04222 domain-containing membrane protein [Micromonospora yasonensis]
MLHTEAAIPVALQEQTMTVLASSGDTWGIPGPVFLTSYVTAAAVILLACVVHRYLVLRGRTPKDPVDAESAAYLGGGEQLAVWTALAGMHRAGVVGVRARGRLESTGYANNGMTPLEQALHGAAARGARTRDLHLDPHVARALAGLRQRLEQRGLLVGRRQRRVARAGVLALSVLLLVGVVRVVAGLSAGRPAGYLILSVLALALLLIVLRPLPNGTRAGHIALTGLRRKHTYLSPGARPAYTTYGSAEAAMGVALFGTASLWAIDAEFAQQAQVKYQALAGNAHSSGWSGGGGGSCGTGGSSCGSGGSSCGGGGGCGG